jgi:hypothetical protein
MPNLDSLIAPRALTGLKKAIDALFVGAAQLFCKAEDADSLEQLIAKIEDRDPAVRALLIEMAAE